MGSILDITVDWFLMNELKIFSSLVVISIYFIFRKIIYPKLEKNINRDQLKTETLESAIFTLNLFFSIIVLVLILLIWGVELKSLLAISTGLIAITGVALFASWSILSNITSFFILLTHKSYRRDNFVRVIDQDNYIEGYIAEINLFNTKIIGENNEVVIYPNNLLIARPVIINPKDRHSVVGKTQDLHESIDKNTSKI